MSKKVFVTGAAGYIGGSVAIKLVQAGYQVSGLTRSQASADKLRLLGVEPILGDLADAELLTKCGHDADIVVDAADSDNENAVRTLVSALKGSDKLFIHTSGSSIVADQANGEVSDRVFDERTEYRPEPGKQARVDIDNFILNSAKDGIRSVVICPCMIYGKGLGLKSESHQIPALTKAAIEIGIARHIGKGENIWSNVHIEDLADLYLLVIEKAPTGGVFLFAENGESSLKQIVEKIREGLGLKTAVENWPIADASAKFGAGMAIFGLGSNSRIRGVKSRELGWKPKINAVLDDAVRCCSSFTAGSTIHH
jgi:nucleoside-diphosphate-sugar epimerase